MSQNAAKVVIFIPNSRWFGKRPWPSLPYAVLILTAILKEHYNLSILDANALDLCADQCSERLRASSADIVMVSGLSVEYHRQAHEALRVSKWARPCAQTVLGGVYATTLPDECLKDDNADWVFMYHAEDRVNEFLGLIVQKQFSAARNLPGIAYRTPEGSAVINRLTHSIGRVDRMVKPDYSLVDLTPYLRQASLDYQFNSDGATAFIITSYGCPYNCNFCASRTISGRTVAFRPADDVLEEIDYLVSHYNVANIVFLDDCILADRKRAERIFEGIFERKYKIEWKVASLSAWHLDREILALMKRAGCTQLTISVESGSQRVVSEIIHKPLKLSIVPRIVKECREIGIDLGANFVIGMPGETWEDIRQTFKFAEECDFDVVHFHIATPLPKTDLYYTCKEKEYLPSDFSFLNDQLLGYTRGFITTSEFTPFELSVVRAFEWDRINFSTPEKAERVARLYKTTAEKLRLHRQHTRRKLGQHF